MQDPSITMADQLVRVLVWTGLGAAIVCTVVSAFALAGYTVWRAWLK